MLVRLEVENFYSVRDRQVLDFRLPDTTPDDPRRFVLLPFQGGIRIPKVAAFFGPNASGKTTILRAVAFIADFIEDSFDDYKVGEAIQLRPFATKQCANKDTKIRMDFCLGDGQQDVEGLFTYELHVRHTGLMENELSLESLRRLSADGKSHLIFERQVKDGVSKTKVGPELGIKNSDPRLAVRSNVSLISSLIQFAHPQAQKIVELLKLSFSSNILFNKYNTPEEHVTSFYKKTPPVLDVLNRMIKSVDLGIERVEIKEVDGSDVAFFDHTGLDTLEPLFFESQGTRNFFCIFPDLAFALGGGGTAIMDEIDSDLHPALMPEIVNWFHEQSNTRSAQLIMTCHNASLLHNLVKEEVWLVEKDSSGASSVYPLRAVRGVRRDTNLYSKYISGAFGGIPRLG